ncbi:helix-turn-helix transcriptional regulator [Marinicella litoralis]|nr:AraC family transcriptional regulator [Marinicella litoralis]
MIWLDAFFRFSGVGMLLFTVFMALRDLSKSSSLVLLLLVQLCMLCHFLGFTPNHFNLPYGIRVSFRLIDVFLLSTVWLFVLSLFQKNFRVNFFHVLTAVLMGWVMLMERFVYFGWLDDLPGWWPSMVNSMAFILVMHMLAVTLLGRNDDLLEKRRKSRLYMVLVIATSTLLTLVLGSMLLQEYQATVNVISLSPAIFGMAVWMLQIEPNTFSFKPNNQLDKVKFSARDHALQLKLDEVIERHRCYLEPNITIDTLASRLAVSAPRLRVFINHQLGFSNFSSYINSYRIEAIKTALQDNNKEHIPILTLALNHGFNSLAPFNRAFKQQVGLTPSVYRKNLAK